MDESGDFGDYEKHAPYYIVTLVLHDQEIKAQTGTLSRSEELLFHSKRDLKKDFLKGIHKKEFK